MCPDQSCPVSQLTGPAPFFVLSSFPQPSKGGARIPGPPPPAGQHPINPHIKSSRADKEVGTFSLRGGLGTLLPFWGTRNLPKLGLLPQPLAPALAPPDKKLLCMRRTGWPGLTRALKEAVAPVSPGCPFPHAEASFSCN